MRAALPPLVFIGLILKEPDLGHGDGVCAAVTMLMLYLAGLQIKYIGLAMLAASPVLYYMLFRVPWRRARHAGFRESGRRSARDRAFISMQSLIAVGYGRLSGARFDGRTAETLLSARGVDRFYLCKYLARSLACWGRSRWSRCS